MYAMVPRRSLHLDVDNVAMRALLPVADWTNHSFEPNTRLATNLSDGSFELRSMVSDAAHEDGPMLTRGTWGGSN